VVKITCMQIQKLSSLVLLVFYHLPSQYLLGINEPNHGMGLGSFANRPNKGAMANICFFESKQKIFIEVLEDVKIGDELLCHYGKGFKI